MSNNVNTELDERLYEAVADAIDYWAGEGVGKQLEKVMSITPSDTDTLRFLLEIDKKEQRLNSIKLENKGILPEEDQERLSHV